MSIKHTLTVDGHELRRSLVGWVGDFPAGSVVFRCVRGYGGPWFMHKPRDAGHFAKAKTLRQAVQFVATLETFTAQDLAS